MTPELRAILDRAEDGVDTRVYCDGIEISGDVRAMINAIEKMDEELARVTRERDEYATESFKTWMEERAAYRSRIEEMNQELDELRYIRADLEPTARERAAVYELAGRWCQEHYVPTWFHAQAVSDMLSTLRKIRAGK